MSPSSYIAVVVAATCACAYPSAASAQKKTPYGVTADVANGSALLKAATYTFTPGQPSYDKTVDQAIITAIDREMSARGVKKVTSGPDLVVTYLSVRRTDVDLKSTPSAKDGTLREYAVGTLIVSISDPADRQKKLFNGRIDKPLDLDPATYEATINAAVAAIFEKYPLKGKTP